jgi:hypothetical protein
LGLNVNVVNIGEFAEGVGVSPLIFQEPMRGESVVCTWLHPSHIKIDIIRAMGKQSCDLNIKYEYPKFSNVKTIFTTVGDTSGLGAENGVFYTRKKPTRA